MTNGEKAAALIGGVGAVALVVVAAAAVKGSSPVGSPIGREGCCPTGEAFVGMAGTAPVCSTAATEQFPCPCGCVTGAEAACQGYTPIAGAWGCCPPGQSGCDSAGTPPVIADCQTQCCPGGGAGPGIVGGSCVFCLNGIGGCSCGSACPNAPTASGMVVSVPGVL